MNFKVEITYKKDTYSINILLSHDGLRNRKKDLQEDLISFT